VVDLNALDSGHEVHFTKFSIALLEFCATSSFEVPGFGEKDSRLTKQAFGYASLISLGPTFIKIGQALGTRADLLPLPYVKELAVLQDQVPAFPTADAFARIESELGRPVHDCYAEIDSEPIASASLGQVYRARLATGEEVAVKVQRPDLAETISIDVAILYRLVKLTNRFFPKANENADWKECSTSFITIFEELTTLKREETRTGFVTTSDVASRSCSQNLLDHTSTARFDARVHSRNKSGRP
jgi:predicted unusual protein kinase regulating ubiquinone biosynthesis (AarF/ABC1/UbiB family)